MALVTDNQAKRFWNCCRDYLTSKTNLAFVSGTGKNRDSARLLTSATGKN